MNDYHFERLYNIHYTQTMRRINDDVRASVEAYDATCEILRTLNRQELRHYIRQHDSREGDPRSNHSISAR